MRICFHLDYIETRTWTSRWDLLYQKWCSLIAWMTPTFRCKIHKKHKTNWFATKIYLYFVIKWIKFTTFVAINWHISLTQRNGIHLVNHTFIRTRKQLNIQKYLYYIICLKIGTMRQCVHSIICLNWCYSYTIQPIRQQ